MDIEERFNTHGGEYARAYELRMAGLTYAQIANQLDMNLHKARKLVDKEELARLLPYSGLYGLPTRARNALMSYGLTSRECVLKAVADGSLDPAHAPIPNFGLASYYKVLEWAEEQGVTSPDAPCGNMVCKTCGYAWKAGHAGRHRCTDVLINAVSQLEAHLRSVIDEYCERGEKDIPNPADKQSNPALAKAMLAINY